LLRFVVIKKFVDYQNTSMKTSRCVYFMFGQRSFSVHNINEQATIGIGVGTGGGGEGRVP